MLQRSKWSSVLLAAAVISTAGVMSSAYAADEAAAPAPAPAAPAADATPAPAPATAAADAATPGAPAANSPLQNLADDFMHYSLVNNMELAKANAQAIINANPDPKDLLKAFEDASNGRNPRDIMIQNQNRPELKEVSAKVLEMLEGGYRAVARDPVRIRADIDRLANGPRAYANAREHLTAAGQFAAPFFIEYLQSPGKQNLHPYILRVMGEIGRPLLLPLMEDLNSSDQTVRIELVKVIGQIGYPQALPTLRAISTDSNSGSDLKAAADAAVSSIDARAANVAPADLYLSSAEKYYHKQASYLPLLADEPTNPVWMYDKGLNNVQPLAVPTAIWNDVMTLHAAESTLKLNSNNGQALSLWLSADLRREIELPKGATDPTAGQGTLDASFYALAAGPVYVNPVLGNALDAKDSALALRAIDALEATGGISGLVSARDGAPLVRALDWTDQAVRFRAAFALARANPTSQFGSYFRVVPTLAEALATGGDNAKTSVELLGVLAADHKTIYNVNDAVPALIDAMKGKDAAVSGAAAKVLGEMNSADAQRAIASAALAADVDAGMKVPLFNALAESAKHTGNALDSSSVNSLIKVVSGDADAGVRKAAATALGALNVPSNQASALILQQAK